MVMTGMRNSPRSTPERRNIYREKYENAHIVRQEALRKMEHEREKGDVLGKEKDVG